jgi:hypothetical protein
VSETEIPWNLKPATEQFEIKVLEAENALYRKHVYKLKLENAELRALLKKHGIRTL